MDPEASEQDSGARDGLDKHDTKQREGEEKPEESKKRDDAATNKGPANKVSVQSKGKGQRESSSKQRETSKEGHFEPTPSTSRRTHTKLPKDKRIEDRALRAMAEDLLGKEKLKTLIESQPYHRTLQGPNADWPMPCPFYEKGRCRSPYSVHSSPFNDVWHICRD